MPEVDYAITFGEGGPVIGEALTPRAREMFGEGETEIDMSPQDFMSHFPPGWILALLNKSTMVGYILKSKTSLS